MKLRNIITAKVLISLLFMSSVEGCYTQLMTTKDSNDDENEVQQTESLQTLNPVILPRTFCSCGVPSPPPPPPVYNPPPQAMQFKTDNKPVKPNNSDRNFGTTRGGSHR